MRQIKLPRMRQKCRARASVVVRFERDLQRADRANVVIRLPSFEQVRDDPIMEAHASRILHTESNPGNARPACASSRRP